MGGVGGVGPLVVLSVLGVAGLLLLSSGLMQPTPSLHRALAHLRRPAAASAGSPSGRPVRRIGRWLAGSDPARGWLDSVAAELQLARRTPDEHAVRLGAAAAAGFIVPLAGLSVLHATGLADIRWFLPLAVSIVCAAAGPVLVHLHTLERAASERTDLRYQLSAYLDVVTMLLAGNTGYEGALEQASHAGDGRLFVELRRRMREAAALGASLTSALDRGGRELGLDELEQIAATCTLSAAEGAPVARTLAAKCATLRAALASEQETEARLRTSRLTAPIVGMALIFMALVIYPALSVP